MQEWLKAFLCALIVPFLIILAGGAMVRFTSKSGPNAFLGYRTARARKSAAAWEYAQIFCGKLWRPVGGLLAIATTLRFFQLMEAGAAQWTRAIAVFAAIGAVALLATIPVVEWRLKTVFDENGKRR